jgi:hypothetical protein
MSCTGRLHSLSDVGLCLRLVLSGLVISLAMHADSLRACTACYGQSDSPMAAGMNWGIMSLLVVVGVVLGGVASFFVYLAKRAASVAAGSAAGVPLESTGKPWPRGGSGLVLGSSEGRMRWGLGTLRPARQIGTYCARGRAHSGQGAFDSELRKLHPGSADSVL